MFYEKIKTIMDCTNDNYSLTLKHLMVIDYVFSFKHDQKIIGSKKTNLFADDIKRDLNINGSVVTRILHSLSNHTSSRRKNLNWIHYIKEGRRRRIELTPLGKKVMMSFKSIKDEDFSSERYRYGGWYSPCRRGMQRHYLLS
tara:strand:+ start:497 stop:922 length:426 start_codon:yes stop_codon:yes gene_type:complete